MKNEGEIVVSVTIDTTEIKAQVDELMELLKSSTKGLPDDFVGPILSKLSTVVNDIVLCDSSTTTITGFNIIHRVRLGSEFERLTAAIRAGELNLESF